MIDTHAHLDLEYYDTIEDVIKKMKDNKIIVSGIDTKTNQHVLDLVKKYKNVYGTIGIHPESVMHVEEEDFLFLENHLNDEKIVGIGEIGLDYHYENDFEKQKEVFIRQIYLANRFHKTMVIHSRDAIEDTYNLLKKYKDEAIKVDIHCYSSSLEMAKRFIPLNAMFGIGGVVTFKNSKVLKEVVEHLPLEYLLLETDSPFLSPEPLRGTKNEPYNILYIAQKIAEIKNISLETVLRQTTLNATYQFDLPTDL